MEEVWKDIPLYEGLYQASNLGRIKSLRKNKIMSQQLNKYGYSIIILWKNGYKKTIFVHRLIAMAFLKMSYKRRFVNHKDGNKLNNNVNNLEWCSTQENNVHAYKTGLNTWAKKVILIKCGKEIARFNSMAEAGRYLGIGRNAIFNQIHFGKNKSSKTKDIKWVLI